MTPAAPAPSAHGGISVKRRIANVAAYAAAPASPPAVTAATAAAAETASADWL